MATKKTTKRASAKPRGRPPEYKMPEPIDAPPERVAEVVLQAKPKNELAVHEAGGEAAPNPGPEA